MLCGFNDAAFLRSMFRFSLLIPILCDSMAFREAQSICLVVTTQYVSIPDSLMITIRLKVSIGRAGDLAVR